MNTSQQIIAYWLEKAQQDIAAARDNVSEERFSNAVSDAYFACFHALTALLIQQGKTCKTHKEVRSTLHRDYIKTGKLESQWGKHYDWLFKSRHQADYSPLVHFDAEKVDEVVEKSAAFVKYIKELLETETTA